MTAKIEDLADKLGAQVVGRVPEHSAGAFGVAKLRACLDPRSSAMLLASPVGVAVSAPAGREEIQS
jgi:hypothetical protein